MLRPNKQGECRICFWMMWNDEYGWMCSREEILKTIDPSNRACYHFRVWNEPEETERCLSS